MPSSRKKGVLHIPCNTILTFKLIKQLIPNITYTEGITNSKRSMQWTKTKKKPRAKKKKCIERLPITEDEANENQLTGQVGHFMIPLH